MIRNALFGFTFAFFAAHSVLAAPVTTLDLPADATQIQLLSAKDDKAAVIGYTQATEPDCVTEGGAARFL